MAESGTGALFGIDDEMARVMASHDWSDSPVGPPDEWPPLLQTLVRSLVTSRFSMWLGWGPDLAFFYNKAYAQDTLGVKHPWALGRPAREVWSEIWGELKPRVDTVMEAGRATWDEALLLFLERSGYREETYHTFSYSPLNDVDGHVVGLLCVVSEETKRVIAERRMATLRDLSAAVSTARTEPEVFAAVSAQLAGNLEDLPFTLTYVFDAEGRPALTGATGGADDHPLTGGTGAANPWPLSSVRRSGQPEVVALASLPGGAQWPSGAWPDPPAEAVLVPFGDGGRAEPTGVFVAGVNPYRVFDEDYLGFAELVGSAIGSGVASARAYEAERRRAESLAELDRAKTEFFSNVSHEFRTPLTLIMAPTDDALNDDLTPLPGPQRQRLEVVQRNARRLRRLVNDMLDFARIEGGRLQAETVATDLVEFTRDLVLSFAPVFERSGLDLELDLEPLGRTVHVDRDMWEKILLNLLSNALKFTLEGGVRVRLAGVGDEVELTVTDTGVGIPAEHQERLFERFYRAPRSAARSHEGTGIGLALVWELARLHGGRVAVRSAEGEGSTFTVVIPFGRAAGNALAVNRESSLPSYLDEALQWVGSDGDRSAAESRTSRQSVVGATASSTVLVVDDNPDMRSYLLRLLQPYWKVAVAGDGAEALEMVRSEPPDLVLTDVMMPRLDGFELLAALREDPATATIPVVFLSARAGEDAAVVGLEAGADDYLVKPFSGLELLARVRSNLELAGLRNREAAWRSALVESLQDAVAVIDASGCVIEANAAFETITGFPRSGLPYAPPYPWMLPDGVPGAVRGVELGERLTSGERLHSVVTIRHRLGHQVQVALTASPLGVGEDWRAVVAFHDVTAELAASERDSALARLGIRLAEASDVAEVHEAGLLELRRAFGAVRASVVVRSARSVGEEAVSGGGTPLGTEAAAALLEEVSRASAVTLGPSGEGGPLVAGMGATLDPSQGHSAVWLQFDSPRPVTADERALFAVLCGYFGQAVRRAQLFDDSRAVATAMQRSILGPTEVPSTIAVRYFPAVRPLEVGGDWYDVVQLDSRRLGVVVGDCTGRGLPAATTMGQLRSACRAVLLQAKGPAEVIASLDTFAERLPGALCTTVFCGVIDDVTQTLRYSSAGHLPGLLLGPGGDHEWLDRGQGVPLGYQSGVERPEAEVELTPGSTLLLYTDGLVERRRESLDVGMERLRQALLACPDRSPEAVADCVLDQLVPSGGHDDDIALLVYAQPATGALDRLEIALSSAAGLSSFRREVRSWLAGHRVDGPLIDDVLIAVGEALANAIEHAYGFQPGPAQVVMELTGSRLSIEVADTGRWREGGSEVNRGRGLQIMTALTDQLEVERTPEGTTVRMTKDLAS